MRFVWGAGGHLLLLPFVMLVWVNMHAGAMIGFLLIGAVLNILAMAYLLGFAHGRNAPDDE